MSRNIQSLIKTLGSLSLLDSRVIHPSQIQLRNDVGNIDDLAQSIKENGLLQPIVVRPKSDYFEVVAGNRRLAACKSLRASKILCMIKELTDKQAYEVSLVENVQRETLDPIEEAQAFANYVKKYGYGSTTELARQIGKSEEYVSHRILLLTLPHEILQKVSSRQLAPTAAEELIWVRDPVAQKELAKEITESKLSAKKIRKVVKLVRRDVRVSDAVRQVSDSLADFDARVYETDDENDEIKLIGEAALIFKSTLIHLDSLIDRITEDNEVRRSLISKRYVVHQLLDDVIKMRNGRLRSGLTR
jgi:ParB family chromosome partitioning protein